MKIVEVMKSNPKFFYLFIVNLLNKGKIFPSKTVSSETIDELMSFRDGKKYHDTLYNWAKKDFWSKAGIDALIAKNQQK
jgi:hypothetical protein